MTQLIQRLLACVLMSAAVTGGTAIYGSNQLSRIDPADVPGLAAFIEMVPDAVQWQYVTIRTNNVLFAEFLNDAVEFEPTEEWSESSYVQAYDAAGHSVGSYFPPTDDADESVMTTNEYNEDGNLVRSVSYQGGQPYTENQTTYDNTGRIQSRTSRRDGEIIDASEFYYTPQADGTYLRRIRYASGREETDVINAAGQPLRSEWEGGYSSWAYDDKGRPTEIVIETATLSQRTEYTYHDAADGSYTCADVVYENGALRSRTESRFDAHGICLYTAQYTAAGELLIETTAEFFTP